MGLASQQQQQEQQLLRQQQQQQQQQQPLASPSSYENLYDEKQAESDPFNTDHIVSFISLF